ncbi:MAG: transglycosylase SLT domain-containing protein, partial [Methyloprofundus sp.]|nr:transglycosylase SLT domain-containing protein [Methyloprofundus sp.]
MLKLCLLCYSIALLILPVQLIRAEQLTIPVVLDYPVLQQIMLNEVFTQAEHSLKYSLDASHCNTVTFSKPILAHEAQQLLIQVKTQISLGLVLGDTCRNLTQWQGYSALLSKPLLKSKHPLQIFFSAQEVRLFNAQGGRIHNQLLSNAIEAQIDPIMNQFKVDLRPATRQAGNLLEAILPHHSTDAVHALVSSSQLARLGVTEHGLAIDLSIDVQKPPIVKQTEEELSETELHAFNAQWQQWDAFFTFIIKQLASQTKSDELRDTLLDILLDTRYQIQTILQQRSSATQDPVKALFIRSWQQLRPVVHQISLEADSTKILPVFSFMTAADALQTLEKLGPEFGLEISTDGLRRLARLLNRQNKQPLQYMDTQDPDLLQLFKLNASEKPKPISWNLNPISIAQAETNVQRLNHWVPSKSEIPAYLSDIRVLILQQLDKGKALSQEHQKIYRQLLLTTAWQESCWRQYVVKQRKIAPLSSSTGDVGLFQVNERVWRGIYAKHKLRWDIAYNAHAGGDILYRYLTRYAIKKQEHKQPGGMDNLARSAYSTYNGGPSRVARYRQTKGIPAFHKKIDQAFWEKYRQVKQGKEYAVAQCLGAPSPANLSKSNLSAIKAKTVAAKASAPDHHFTLQLAALSDKQAAEKMRKSFKVAGQYQYYAIKKNRKTLYLLTYGNFATKNTADKAVTKFSTVKPWVRTFKSIR